MITYGVVVSKREGKGDDKLVDNGVVSSAVTYSTIRNRSGGKVVNGEVVFDMTCFRRSWWQGLRGKCGSLRCKWGRWYGWC